MLINELKKIYTNSSHQICTKLRQKTDELYDVIVKEMKECIGDTSNGSVDTYSYDFSTDGSNVLFEDLIKSLEYKFASDGLAVEQTELKIYDSGMKECTLTFSGWSE